VSVFSDQPFYKVLMGVGENAVAIVIELVVISQLLSLQSQKSAQSVL
jgi:hypothetical protein